MGGLGNQMFQAAAGFALADQYKVPLKLDTTFLEDRSIKENFTYRNYELNCFDYPFQIADKVDIKKSMPIESFLVRNLYKLLPFTKWVYYLETEQGFEPSFFQLPSNVYLEGYWQSEKYIQHIKKKIWQLFTFKEIPDQLNRNIANFIKNVNSVSVHIRRSDYVSNASNNQYHGTCDLAYYEKAIQYVIAKINNPVFYFFSDDMEWVLENFGTLPFEKVFVTGNLGTNSYIDMQLMSDCRHNIVANSSFSWWGAWLNQNEDKMVIAPKIWFANQGKNQQTEHLIPQNWISI